MSTDREVTRIVRSWLDEGATALPDRVLDAVLDQVPATPQRRTAWSARRLPDMNNMLKVALSAAAVVVVAVVGINLLPGGGGPGGAAASPSAAAPSASAAPTPVRTAEAGLPAGPLVVTGTDDPVQITLDIAAPGWGSMPEFNAVTKDDDSLDPPETVGAALLAWTWPAGTGFNVYEDPCRWSSSVPESPATTPEGIAAAFAAQASTDATAPVFVTVGGFTGMAITLRVPMSFDLPNASREEKFAECDEDTFAFYGIEGHTGHARNAQGAGQIDELWILDVDGSIVFLDAMYGPVAPAELVKELRALAESATFE